MILLFYCLALVALLTGTAAIWMALIEVFPVRWLRIHYFIRKPVTWGLFALTLLWGLMQPVFPWALLGPLVLMALAVILTYRMHQSVAFPAIDFPPHAEAADLPLSDDMEIAVIDYGGVTRAYALDHLIHHHIINDRFGDRIVAVTYCAMCRSIIPFDVTEIGPLFVGSFKNANMIVADRRTITWFQQASFESILGPLHPMTLQMIPYQLLNWRELRSSGDIPPFAAFTRRDLRDFELPIPGVWRRIMASEVTPGLARARHDTSLPARTHVIGLMERGLPPLAVRRDVVRARGVVALPGLDIALVSAGGGVNGFRVGGQALALDGTTLTATGRRWSLRGKALDDGEDLPPVALSDEYWFSWKLFHPAARLVGDQ
ncbi:MAG: DUF3179 domain-containing protein [Rhodobacteraceae bacterium]|nr:DUF3179 domain-containing protein [Paracoccaceae bacterium]